MALTSKQLVAQLQTRLSAIDSQIIALQKERELLTGATAGIRRGTKRKAALKKVRTAASKAGKKGKANPNSPQAMAQYGRRYSDAVKAGDGKQAAEYAAKLNKTAYGKNKLKELKAKSGKPRAKKAKASAQAAA
jgi:hypothetical protein